MRETWKPVVGYEGLYEVSDLGNVRSLDRVDALGRLRKGRQLTPRKTVRKYNGDAYLQVTLARDGKNVQTQIHVIVCRAFHGEKPTPQHQVDHINNNPSDNRAENLEWVTASENILRKKNWHRYYKPVMAILPNGDTKKYDAIKYTELDGYSPKSVSSCTHGRIRTHKGARWVLL